MSTLLESPTKKQHVATVPVAIEPAELGLRGSFARQASTSHADSIRFAATNARATISQKALGVGPSGRVLGANRQLGRAQTMPTLGFGASSSTSQIYTSTNEINAAVFSSGGSANRANELRPFWETGSDDGSSLRGGSFGRSASLVAGGSGVFSDETRTRETTMDDDAADGFDMDEVFGQDSFNGGGGGGDFGESHDSQSSNATVTKSLKRAFEAPIDDEVPSASGEDEEMETTDVEDEVPELPVSGRRFAGSARRGLSKTQSLPNHVFSSTDF
ncbi:hypothetical protein MNV49_005859 [Pseudohyphozyma bogoriensis]|nr:hypothetical protein MNV49_005859 [Pseudohyphozyma bogoriensis]